MQDDCVVIVGASSGIGYALGVALVRSGCVVFGTCREKPAVSDHRIKWLSVDLADPDAPTRLRSELAKQGCISLRALIHCAGVCIPSPVDQITCSDFADTFNANLFGPLLVTAQLLDLMVPSSRIIYLGSSSGRATLPLLGAYSASKFALRALTDAQRMELRARRLQVVLVESGNVATPIWERSAASLRMRMQGWDPRVSGYYRSALLAMERLSSDAQSNALPVENVADKLMRLVYQARVPALVRLGRDAWLWWVVDRLAPPTVRDWALSRLFSLR